MSDGDAMSPLPDGWVKKESRSSGTEFAKHKKNPVMCNFLLKLSYMSFEALLWVIPHLHRLCSLALLR